MNPKQIAMINDLLAEGAYEKFTPEQKAIVQELAGMDVGLKVPEGLNLNPTPVKEQSAMGRAVDNALEDGKNVVGGLYQAVRHPFETIQALGNVGVGAQEYGMDAIYDLLGKQRGQGQTKEQQMAKAVWDDVSNTVRHPIDSYRDRPFSTLLTLAPGIGAVGKLLKMGGRAAEASNLARTASVANRAGQVAATTAKYAEPVTDVLALTKNVAGPVAKRAAATGAKYTDQLLGTLSGSYQAMQESRKGSGTSLFKWAKGEGPSPFQTDFKKYQTGIVPEEQIAREVIDGTRKLYKEQNKAHGEVLKKLAKDRAGESVPVGNLYDKFIGKIKEEGVNIVQESTKSGEPLLKLDFERSPFVDAADQRRITSAWHTLRDWSDDSVLGVDRLKKKLGKLYEDRSLTKGGTVSNIIIGDLNSEITGALKQFDPAYATQMEKFAYQRETLDALRRGLVGAGKKEVVETALNKLKGALGENKSYRHGMLEELSRQTGTNLGEKLAGVASQNILPHGITGKTMSYGLAGLGSMAAGGQVGQIPGALAGLGLFGAATSPRLLGSGLNYYGILRNTAQEAVQYAAPYAGKFVTPTQMATLNNLIQKQRERGGME